MKHLKDFIYEAIPKDLQDAFWAEITNPNASIDKAREAYSLLKHAHKLGEPTGNIIHHKAEYEINPKTGKPYKRGQEHKIKDPYDELERESDPNKIGDKLSKINISTNAESQIINILRKNNMLDRYIYYINNSTKHFTARDLIKGSGSNIFNLLKPYGINLKTLKELAALTDIKDTISQGQFEILLKMFLTDLSINNRHYKETEHGDIHAGGRNFEIFGPKFGSAFELKGKDARIGSKGHNPGLMNDYLDKELKSKGIRIKLPENPFNRVNNIKNTISEMYKFINNDKELFDIVYQSMLAQFNFKYGDPLSDLEKDDLTKAIFNNGEVKDIDGVNGITRLLMAVQLYHYCKEEGFNYFVLINVDNGDYICEDTKNFTIPEIFKHKHIGVVNGSGGSTGARDNFCQVNLK